MARDITTKPQSKTMVQALQIRQMIAGSSVFQARLGVETPEEAVKRVYADFVQSVDVLTMPYVIMQIGETVNDAVSGGVGQGYLPTGRLKVTYEDFANTPDPGESIVDFYNFYEASWQDVLDCSGFGGLPKITRSAADIPVLLAEENSPGEKPFWRVNIDVEWNFTG